jgi:hypothetical protein
MPNQNAMWFSNAYVSAPGTGFGGGSVGRVSSHREWLPEPGAWE